MMMRYRRPDLVLLDLMLPDMGGGHVIERIRATPEWRHVPIVVVSAQDEMDHAEALRGAMTVAKADGLMPSEVVQWVQKVVDTTMRTALQRQMAAEAAQRRANASPSPLTLSPLFAD
jgi:CheY-like chemotaxis protein